MSVMLSCNTAVKEHTTNSSGMMETGKKNIGNLLALYPKLACRRTHGHYRSRPYTREYE